MIKNIPFLLIICLINSQLTAQNEIELKNSKIRIEDQATQKVKKRKAEFSKNIETNIKNGSKDELCVPEYSTGCSDGDGFTPVFRTFLSPFFNLLIIRD